MKGVPGIGKTFQTRRFMVDWANRNSNKKIDLIVTFNFTELNSEKEKVQSMKDLLHCSLKDSKHGRDYSYDDCKILFVLDGLEKCELPLDFEKNKELTDMEKPASMDVLLTNLIVGTLLPSALLWIISQPSGIDKIPPGYIHKKTECREMLHRRMQLISALRERLRRENTQDEDMHHPNKKNTEHIMREDRSAEVNVEEQNGRIVPQSVTPVNAVPDLFKARKGQTVRTVLTIGEAGIGKSYNVQKFINEWAKKNKRSFLSKGAEDAEVVFPLNLSKFNLIKEKEVSFLGLLNHFFKETKSFIISNFEQFKVLFVLDGLDAYEPPLNFDNNITLTDMREPASVDVLLTNLIRGTLFPSARLWITSRLKLPDMCVDRITEIRSKPDIVSQQKLKTQLKEQFTHVSEGIDMQRKSSSLKDIYTDLYIIEGERGEVNDQHEVRQVQDAKFKDSSQETLIKCHDIFKPGSGDNKCIRTVLTIGMAGIGKSFATMKYMLDWAEGTANKDIFYIFPLSFRELNLRKEETHSLEKLIHDFFPGMETSEIRDYDKYKILIILDGFDECRFNLDFNESEHRKGMRETSSVSVLLTDLIQGNLLSKAQIWITSRPAASNFIPAGEVDRVTEVRGFCDEQKEEYFRKRFSDKDLAEKVLSHVKKSRSIYIMCHIPVFCWVTSKVLEDLVSRNEEERMPKTLTDMYIYFLLLEARQTNVKYGEDGTGESSETDSCWNNRNQKTIKSLGKLAFEGLVKGNFLFTENFLEEVGVDITETAVFSGLFTQIKQEGRGLYQQKFLCFVHLSIQEFLAAFYVFHKFSNEGENLLTPSASTMAKLPALDFYKIAVDKALDSKNGDWDLFLRFLLGLSLETNQNLLPELLKKTEHNKETNKETIAYIKEKISEENSDPDKNYNLFHCLNELNDHSLVEEVKKYLHSDAQIFENFSPSQWSALTFVLLTSEGDLDVFDLKNYLKSEKVLLGMLSVVKVSKTALLSWCELSAESCKGLSSSVLSSASSNLTVLDLSHNDLLDSGVELLAKGLNSLHCKLEILKLSGCQVTEKGCSFLASTLQSKIASSLKHLDLSYNHPGTNGKRMLSDIAQDPNKTLKILCFDHDGEHRLKPGLKKYGADLKLDENTASRRLVLSEGNRKVKTVQMVEEKVERPENKDRFKRTQVLCEKGQEGLCYWEVEWKGTVGIAVTYRGVGRKWDSNSGLGCNEMSWSLICQKKGYTAIHGQTTTNIDMPLCHKIAVFLDWERGTLTYYSVTAGKLRLIHTFNAKFTKPLFPGFWFRRGSVTLCEID
uniref:NLR family CARD domain-containing protein 3-like n=1 Tax=Scatophagus argus TaxID=75038 RepID=UPI001ED8116B|nr:NLR family CARD domain-containing protein 3-like [Scatophagus argus]